jgi:hypothetical protein
MELGEGAWCINILVNGHKRGGKCEALHLNAKILERSLNTKITDTDNQSITYQIVNGFSSSMYGEDGTWCLTLPGAMIPTRTSHLEHAQILPITTRWTIYRRCSRP